MYGELVYRLGKRYSKELEANPDVEFPYFTGNIADLVDSATLAELPELQGEYLIAYSNLQGIKHLLRVYFEQGTFELEGTPAESDLFDMSAGAGQSDETSFGESGLAAD